MTYITEARPVAAKPGLSSTIGFLGLSALAYVAATLLTDGVFMGDARDYARSAAALLFGVDCEFLEFGHLAWRPLGTALLTLFVPPQPGDTFWLISHDAVAQLTRAAWVFGLVGVVAAAGWLRLSVRSFAAAAFGVAFLILCKAYLNYAQVASPYIPGLSALFVGLFLASTNPQRRSVCVIVDVIAGMFFALSALFWATYVLALPGAVLAPLALKREWRSEVPRVVRTGFAGIAMLVIVYAIVGQMMGFRSIDDYRTWAAATSHGISIGGLPRVVIGLARSFVDLGDYGQVVKRFLIKDPLNPVAPAALLSLDLGKIAAFYLLLLLMTVTALIGAIGRRAFVVVLLMAVPVMGFAMVWQGGDLERYLPAMAAFTLLAAAAFHEADGRPVLKSVMVAGVVVFAIANAGVMSNVAVQREARVATQRVAGVADLSMSTLVVSHWQDDLVSFNRDRPFHPLNLQGLNIYALMTPGAAETAKWRESAARWILQSWNDGYRVFVSSRIFMPKPDASWNWVEGDDDRVSWRDFRRFFSMFDIAPPAVPNGEFGELTASAQNHSMLERFASGSAVGTSGTATPAIAFATEDAAASEVPPAARPAPAATPGACRVEKKAPRIR